MRDKVTPLIAGLIGIATGVYIFQPMVLEQLDKDGALNPKYKAEAELARESVGDLVGDPRYANIPPPKVPADTPTQSNK